MNILCIGGGPAGLYFALLMKNQNPQHHITVVERNRPYDTFGWGVVFSDKTLENLQQADAPTGQLIADAFNHWDDIEVFFKGRSVRSHRARFLWHWPQALAQHLASTLRRAGCQAAV